jgi:hypothetical protein
MVIMNNHRGLERWFEDQLRFDKLIAHLETIAGISLTNLTEQWVSEDDSWILISDRGTGNSLV